MFSTKWFLICGNKLLLLLSFVLFALVQSYAYLSIYYYQHIWNVFLHHKQKLWKVVLSSYDVFFYVVFSFDTLMISKQLPNYFYWFFSVFNFLFFCIVHLFSFPRTFYDIFVVFIEDSYKFFFSSYCLFTFFSQHNFCIVSKKLFGNSKSFNELTKGFINLDAGLHLIVEISFNRFSTHLLFCFIYNALLFLDSYWLSLNIFFLVVHAC